MQPNELIFAVQYTVGELEQPPSVRATDRSAAASISTNCRPGDSDGTLHSPKRLPPHAPTTPLLRRATVWPKPAASWTYEPPEGIGGMLACPTLSSPHPTAELLLRSATECPPPAVT